MFNRKYLFFVTLILGGMTLSSAELPIQSQSQTDSPWQGLLAMDQLTPATAQMPTSQLRSMGLFPRKTFEKVWDNWLLLDATTLEIGNKFLAANGNCSQLLTVAAGYADAAPVALPLPKTEATVDPHQRLYQAIFAIHQYKGGKPETEQLEALRKNIAVIPDAIAERAAVLLEAVPGAIDEHRQSIARINTPEPQLFSAALHLALNYDTSPTSRMLIEKTDLTRLTHASLLLARAVDQVLSLPPVPENGKTKDFAFRHHTPIGTIAINGAQNNTYPEDDYLLILDAAGDDTYHDGAVSAAECPVSMLLDLDGNDTYETDKIAFGVGILGYGILIDCAGNDTYKAHAGLAAAGVGMGLLMDRAGNDSYSIRRYGESAATVGFTILNDMAGNDRYYCYEAAQAYAQVKSCAALVDASGNDVYVAEDKDIIYPSPQTQQHNSSLAQGFGFGRRAHPGDGYSLAGGIAALVEGSGDDSYSAGVFGQGVGYWYALGTLVDFGGDDNYSGVWYSQGACAHYAAAATLDLGGNDRYKLLMNQGQGHGRDYSVGLLHDIGGNDVFENPGNALGNANANGIGLFWKQGGNAEFQCPPNGPGNAVDSRPEHLCIGLFFAEQGIFTFRDDTLVKAKSSWVRPKVPGAPLNHGIGMSK